jgi:phosphohistidine phosphatase
VKRLTILRHAKSSWDDPQLKDFDRPLNGRGWKAARRMGREMKRRGLQFDFVLASPAARVRETLDGLRQEFELNAQARFEPDIYLASEAALLDLVRGLPESVQRPLLVGHNPGLQLLVFALTGDDRIAGEFPTAALAAIELAGQHWSDARPGSGKLVELILPKELD